MNDLTDAADSLIRDRQQARITAATALDDDPDDAARAQQLSFETGVPASVIHGDLEGFERTYKGSLNKTLIDNNPVLQDYVNSHPMAAKISHDDFHNLDAATDAVKSVAGAGLEGFKAGFDPQGFRDELQKFRDYLDNPIWKEFTQDPRVMATATALEAGPKIFSGGITAGATALGEAFYQMSGSRAWADRLTRDLYALAQVSMAGQGGFHLAPELNAPAQLAKVAEAAQKLNEGMKAAEPWVENNQVPPMGVHEVFDEAWKDASKEDIKNLDSALRDSARSKTRERSPELYANLVKQVVGNAKIGIDIEAVRRLYGEDIPEPDDGKLGFIPDLRQQMEAVEPVGGRVEVPLSEWLARVDPEIYKGLKDDISVRSQAPTLNEIKELDDRKEAREEKREKDEATLDYRPAVRVGDKTYEGTNHGDALERAAKDTGLALEDIKAEDGFIDNDGKFLTRKEAYAVLDSKSFEPEAEPPPANEIEAVRRVAGVERPAFEGPYLAEPTYLPGLGPAEGGKWFPLLPEAAEKGGEVLGTDKSITVPRIAGTKLGNILDKVHFGYLDEGTKLLNEFFGNRLREHVGDVDVHIVNDADMAKLLGDRYSTTPGYYSSVHNHIVLTQDMVDGTFPPWYTHRVIMEEADHAMTAIGLRKYPVLRAAVRAVMKDADEHISGEDGKARKAFDYAFTNEIEFMGGVKSRPALQKWAAMAPASKETVKVVEKIRDALGLKDRVVSTWDAIKVIFKDLYNKMFGRVPKDSVLDQIFKLNDIMEKVNQSIEGIAKEQGIGKGDLLQRAESPDLAESDKPTFGKMAIGMNKRWQEKYFKLLEKKNAEDMEQQFKVAERDQRQRQTEEWKQNVGKMHQEVRGDLEGRPDIAIGTFFESGTLFGQKVKEKPILDTTKLSPEQKAVLPKVTYGRGGINPDDLAGAFGLRSGDELVQILAGMQKAKGEMPFREYVRGIANKEVTRRMKARFGDLEENIMNEAIEHVIGNTQMDILHEEMVGLGMKLGKELPFTKEDTKSFAKTKFESTPVGQVTVEKMLRDAGKAGTDAELALLDNKPEEAFQAKQKQYLSMRMAEEAKRFEREQRRFDKLMKQFSAREVKSVLPEYTNFIHQIMGQIGRSVRRSVQDLQQAIARSGYKDLEAFVNAKEGSLREMPVAEFLMDQSFKKQTDEMSVGEFRAVMNSIKTLVHNGRDEMKIQREGETKDLNLVLDEMKSRLEDLGKDKAPRIDRKLNPAIRTIKTYWASSLTTESLLNRWDKDDPRGIFNRFITYPMAEAANHEARLIREFQKTLREAVGDIPDIDKKITNDLFKDPLTGEFFDMRKRNVLGILQNVGNKSNLEKLAKGYGLEPMDVVNWVIQHTTKEDWDRAQRIGDIFSKLSDMADTMAENISGVTFERLPIESLQTPYGQYRGWYNPIKYDPNRPGRSKRLIGPNALEEEGYFRATTPQGYTKGRTGYIAPVELNLDVVPMRIKQMIHDITFRPAVIQASKVFYDSGIQRSVIKNYGEVYAKQLVPYLKDVANFANSMSDAVHQGNAAIEFFRQNLIATLVGFNPHTVAKHGMTAAMNSLTEVGPVNFLKELWGITRDAIGIRNDNWKFAMENSEELQRRMRNWSELIQGQPEVSLMGASPRQFVISAGSSPIAVGDLLSAVPTWLARYRTAVEEGIDHGQAVAEANRAVRRAHGSSAITNRAQIMRSNALGATFSSLYGFFSHMLNKQFELSWKAADSFQGLKAGDLSVAKQHAPALVMGLVSYVIFPALVEELVTPYTNSDRDSWGAKAVKVLGKGMASSFIGVRDFVDGFINTREGGAGLIPTAFKNIYDIAKDIGKGPRSMTREQAGRTIKHAFTAVGTLTGLTNAQEGRTAEFLYRYHQGLEHPKGVMDWGRGLTRGTLKEYRR